MRWLIIVSASLVTVMEPSSTWLTNSFTRSLPRSLAPSSLPIRPSSTIWSRSPFSSTCSTACGDAAAFFFASAIGTSRGLVHFLLQLVEFGLIADGAEQRFLQLVVTLQAGAEVAELGAQIHQLGQGLDLLGDVFRLEVVHILEMQVGFELRSVGGFSQLV